jgi:hypothetical protein
MNMTHRILKTALPVLLALLVVALLAIPHFVEAWNWTACTDWLIHVSVGWVSRRI